MNNNPLPRLDDSPELRERLMPFCQVEQSKYYSSDNTETIWAKASFASPSDIAGFESSRPSVKDSSVL